MTCWKWFGTLAKEAGLEINPNNQTQVDALIHKYIGEQSKFGRCSADWKKARKEIAGDAKMKQELLSQLKTLI